MTASPGRLDRSSTLDGEIALAPDAVGTRASDIQRYVWLFMALGLFARCVRYGLCFPLWEDECFLSANLIDRGYDELLEPLEYTQAAPFLFLWLQKLVVQTFGFHEWGLRLVSFIASVASLFLFHRLASRLTTGRTLVLAVAAFAVAYPAIRYAAEAKQYGTDLLASVALLTLFVEWLRGAHQPRWLWFMAAAVFPFTLLSFPAAFVGGGLSLAILAVVLSAGLQRSWRIVAGWVTFNAALLGGFLLLWLVSARGQNAQTGDAMRRFWEADFLPLTNVIDLARWMIVAHAGDVMAWPVGGPNGASTATFLIGLVGIAALIRTRRWAILGMCVLPAGVNLVAAALRLYPYGGHMRLAIYLGPAVCLLLAIGLSDLRDRLFRPQIQHRAFIAALIAFAVIGIATVGRDIANPYKTASDERARAFAQWFWPSAEFEGDVACLQTDWQMGFLPEPTATLNWGAQYVCNQHIYSHRRPVPRQPTVGSSESERPLRCVQYRIGDKQSLFDGDAFGRWLADMQTQYRLASYETYPIPRFDKREQLLVTVDYIDVLKFVPRAHDPDLQTVDFDSRLSPLNAAVH